MLTISSGRLHRVAPATASDKNGYGPLCGRHVLKSRFLKGDDMHLALADTSQVKMACDICFPRRSSKFGGCDMVCGTRLLSGFCAKRCENHNPEVCSVSGHCCAIHKSPLDDDQHSMVIEDVDI